MAMFVADTEKRNSNSQNIDQLSALEMLRIINDADRQVAEAVNQELTEIAKVVQQAEKTIRGGGSVYYIGAGTSGRLGVLDAAECPPTYGVPQNMFVGVIAGGDKALRNSIEGAEDDSTMAERDLKDRGFRPNDYLIGLTASGRTPYVLGGLRWARSQGAPTALVSCSKKMEDPNIADTVIAMETGPEIVTGSTRMKAGTAQKMVLNMISTCVMIALGKVYGNLMVDLRPTNEKLIDRACRIIVESTGVPYAQAHQRLIEADYHVKTAIAMILLGGTRQEAEQYLVEKGGVLAAAREDGRAKRGKETP